MGLALVVCDTVIQDRQSGKHTLVGLFDRLRTKSLPCVHPAMGIYVSLTSGRGDYPCEIRCRCQETDTYIFSVKGKVTFKDPLQAVNMVFNLQGVRFETEGVYWLEFIVDDVLNMMRMIKIEVVVAGRNPEQAE